MLRELQTTYDKPASSQYSCASANVVTGMGVVKNQSAGTFGYAAAETAADIFFVEKERVPSGYKAAAKDLSDYDDVFVNVAQGEPAKLIAYYPGERFATDQFTGTLAVGDRLAVGTDGKIVKAANTVASKYVYAGVYDDNGHTLALVEVSDTANKNA